MYTRRVLSIVVAVFAIACCSCGKSSGIYPVTGKVLVNGQPAVGASVIFIRKESADPFKEPTPQGIVGEDGSFTLRGPTGDGAAPGEYIVMLEWKEGAGNAKGRSPALNAPDRLKKKYLDSNNPMLTARVEAKPNILPPFNVE
jgi:hypothetical protein